MTVVNTLKLNIRLPQFTVEEAAMVKGSTDFIGLNHYSSWYLSDGVSGEEGWFGDQRAVARCTLYHMNSGHLTM